MQDVTLLKQALPYLRRHKGGVFVVKLGGELVLRKDALASLAEDLSLLSHVGIRLVVVHGGGPQATALSERLGLTPTMVEGRRVTDADTLDVAKMVFAGKINIEILSALKAQGVRAVGLSGVAAGIVHARRREPTRMVDEQTGIAQMVDFGFVGDITSVDTELVSLLLRENYVPVLSSLGADDEGTIYNINADTVASALARGLGAGKLISLTTAPGVLADKDDPGSLIATLTSAQARVALTDGTVGAGMKPKLLALIDAVEGGVERGHVLSGLRPGAMLLELFTTAGCGTLVVHGDGAAEPSAVDGAREAGA